MKIAVTGATGFIGKYVVKELERRSISPILVIHPSCEIPHSLKNHPICRIDISVPPENAFELMGSPDVLIHLAWGGLPNYKSLHHFEAELPAQYHFLRKLLRAGLRNLVVTGTCAEYGMQSGALNESLAALSENPYGFAKNTLRRQLEYLKKEYHFNITWARLFYLYGDGQHENSLLPQLKRAIAEAKETFDMSGGEHKRDYLPVEEAASLLVLLAMTKQDNGIVNVCSGKPVKVSELVKGWLSDNKWQIKLNLGAYPYPDYEPMEFWGDNTKLLKTLQGKS